MITIRQLASCILKKGNFLNNPIPICPGTVSIIQQLAKNNYDINGQISVIQLAKKYIRKHINLNLIRVGSELFSDEDIEEINSAVEFLRLIYATVDVHIGRVEHYIIPIQQSNDHHFIEDAEEANMLTDEWSCANDGIDVFFVFKFAGDTVGLSPIDALCDKNEQYSGVVVALEHTHLITAVVLAHEVGHQLGLYHDPDSHNLLYHNVGELGMSLTAAQGEKMKNHCFVKSGCRL